MASFHAKTRWEMPGKSEKKIIVQISFNSTRYKEFQKKQQKNSKTPLWLIFKPKQVGKAPKRVKIKIIVPISSYPTHYKEFQKNSKKIAKKFKKLKNTIITSFQVKTGWERPRKIENKIYRSDQFLSDPL